MTSPTSRALAEFKAMGFQCQVVERWNHYAGIRVDLFGCIDILAVGFGMILGIQACAGASHAARRAKALNEPRLIAWLAAGGRFEVVSFAKRGERGKRKLWEMRREEIKMDDMRCETVEPGGVKHD